MTESARPHSVVSLVTLASALLVACGGGAVSPTVSAAPDPAASAPADGDDDRDGVVDSMDACPEEPEDLDGFEDGDGCPDLDNDGDGVSDVDDACPNEAAHRSRPRPGQTEDSPGCPLGGQGPYNDGPPGDADNDGYPDDVDQCPNHAETFPSQLDGGCTDDGDGCPDGGAILLVACDFAILDVIPFDSRSADLLPRVLPIIDALAATLNANPELAIEIEGHLDDRERGDLGLRRAQGVRAALIARGVSETRLTTRDLAASQPVLPVAAQRGAALADARAHNRRVAFRITNPPREPGRPRP